MHSYIPFSAKPVSCKAGYEVTSEHLNPYTGALALQGKSGRDQGNLAVKEALGAMLQAWGSPFRWGSSLHNRVCGAAVHLAGPSWPGKHLTAPTLMHEADACRDWLVADSDLCGYGKGWCNGQHGKMLCLPHGPSEACISAGPLPTEVQPAAAKSVSCHVLMAAAPPWLHQSSWRLRGRMWLLGRALQTSRTTWQPCCRLWRAHSPLA